MRDGHYWIGLVEVIYLKKKTCEIAALIIKADVGIPQIETTFVYSILRKATSFCNQKFLPEFRTYRIQTPSLSASHSEPSELCTC